MSTITPRYLICEDYPFSQYSKGDLVYPNKKQIEVFKQFPRIFENKSITYKILERNSNNDIIAVLCLKTNRVYKITDEVVYNLSHLTYTVKFTIAGFKEMSDSYKDIIYVCYDVIEEKCLGKACGIGILNFYDKSKDYGKVEVLK